MWIWTEVPIWGPGSKIRNPEGLGKKYTLFYRKQTVMYIYGGVSFKPVDPIRPFCTAEKNRIGAPFGRTLDRGENRANLCEPWEIWGPSTWTTGRPAKPVPVFFPGGRFLCVPIIGLR